MKRKKESDLCVMARQFNKEFEEENKGLYSNEDYARARRIYVRWKFGNYHPVTVRGKE